MNENPQTAWADERRWDYSHGVLSLEAVAPLYDYTGIPFHKETAPAFQQLLRIYVREAYLEPQPNPASLTLEDKQARLLRAIDNSFNAEWRKEYVEWFLNIWVYKANEHMTGWAEWRTIIMRCYVKRGWWPRLHMPPDRDEAIRQELEDARGRLNDARDIARGAEAEARSEWDRRVMYRFGIDAQAIQAGEPFNSLVLTSDLFMFYVFWARLMKMLAAPELDHLWKSAQAVAPDLNINPKDVPHPSMLRLAPSA